MATALTTSPKASCATASQVTIDPVPRKASPHTKPPVTRPPAEPPLTAPDIPNGSHLAHLQTYITTLQPTPADYATKQAAFTKTADPPNVSNTVVRIAVCPQVFSLCQDSLSSIRIKQHMTSLMDNRANICIMGNLSLLLDLVDILPIPITVAISGEVSLDDCCTKRGYLPLTLPDGMIYWQLCFYCANAVDTIISPQAVLALSDVFTSWMQTGFKDGQPGTIRFDSLDGNLTMKLSLEFHDGLYYCPSDVFTVAPVASDTLAFVHPIRDDLYDPTVFQVHNNAPASILHKHSRYILTSKVK
jgi:hypothetical protein